MKKITLILSLLLAIIIVNARGGSHCSFHCSSHSSFHSSSHSSRTVSNCKSSCSNFKTCKNVNVINHYHYAPIRTVYYTRHPFYYRGYYYPYYYIYMNQITNKSDTIYGNNKSDVVSKYNSATKLDEEEESFIFISSIFIILVFCTIIGMILIIKNAK